MSDKENIVKSERNDQGNSVESFTDMLQFVKEVSASPQKFLDVAPKLEKMIANARELSINEAEDHRQYREKYTSIREEGECLYQTYELKCTKLKEAYEINFKLGETNKHLAERNENLEKEALFLRESANSMGDENNSLFEQVQRLTNTITERAVCSQKNVSEDIENMEQQHANTVSRLDEKINELENEVSMLRLMAQKSQADYELSMRQKDDVEISLANMRELLKVSESRELNIAQSIDEDREETNTSSTVSEIVVGDMKTAIVSSRCDIKDSLSGLCIDAIQEQIEAQKLQLAAKDIALSDITRQLAEASSPPLVVQINVECNDSIRETHSQMLLKVNSDDYDNLSVNEMRERIEQLHISNELLRDETSSLRSEIDELQQNLRFEKDSHCKVINDLKAANDDISRVHIITQQLTDAQKKIVNNEHQIFTSENLLKQNAEEIKALKSQIEINRVTNMNENSKKDVLFCEREKKFTQQIDKLESEIEENRLLLDTMKNTEKTYNDEQKMLNVKMVSLQNSENKAVEKFNAINTSFKNLQTDMLRMHSKHKKDFMELEKKYQYEDYTKRYEKLASLCRTKDKQLAAAMAIMPRFEDITAAVDESLHVLSVKIELIRNAKKELEVKRRQCHDDVVEAQLKASQSFIKAQSAETALTEQHAEIQSMKMQQNIRETLINQLQQRVNELEGETNTANITAIVGSLVSNVVFTHQQTQLNNALANVRQCDSLTEQLAEMAQREWVLVRAQNELTDDAAAITARKHQLDEQEKINQQHEITYMSGQAELQREKQRQVEMEDFFKEESVLNKKANEAVKLELANVRAQLVTMKQNECEQTARSADSEQRVAEMQMILERTTTMMEEVRAESIAEVSAANVATEHHSARVIQLESELTNVRDAFERERIHDVERLKNFECMNVELTLTRERLTSNIDALKRQLDIAQQRVVLLEDKMNTTNNKLEGVREKAAISARQCEELKSTNSQLLSERDEQDDELRRKATLLGEALARLQIEHNVIVEKHSITRSELAFSEGRESAIKQRLTQNKAVIEDLRKNVTKLSQENTVLVQNLSIQRMEAKRLAANIEQQTQINTKKVEQREAALNKELTQLKEENDVLLTQQEIIKLDADVGSNQQISYRIEKLEDENASMRAQLHTAQTRVKEDRNMLREKLLAYKRNGDAKLQNVDIELQKTRTRERALMAAIVQVDERICERDIALSDIGIIGLSQFVRNVLIKFTK